MNHYSEVTNLYNNSSFFYVISIGIDGNYSFVSENYDKHFKFKYDTLKGKPYQITMHPDDTLICQEVSQKCFANPDKLFPATIRKHDGNGGYVITQWEFKALFNEINEPDGIFCTGYNITRQVIYQQELEDAVKQVKSKNKQIREIAFINSHVVRKPLANILGLTSILCNMEMEENLRSICNMLEKSAKELDEVVNNINNKI